MAGSAATTTALTAFINKISNITGLATTAALTAVEDKIPNITGLATTTGLSNIEKKILTVNDMYKQIEHNNLFITVTDYNKFTSDIFENKVKK